MEKKFTERLNKYLDSECSDFDMYYNYELDEDSSCCEVTVYRDDYTENRITINFRYNESRDDLSIELSEGSFYTTREFDYTVKYFWMLVTPWLFPINKNT